MAAELRRRQVIDSLKAVLYRKILIISNAISYKAILNTIISIQLVGMMRYNT